MRVEALHPAIDPHFGPKATAGRLRI